MDENDTAQGAPGDGAPAADGDSGVETQKEVQTSTNAMNNCRKNVKEENKYMSMFDNVLDVLDNNSREDFVKSMKEVQGMPASLDSIFSSIPDKLKEAASAARKDSENKAQRRQKSAPPELERIKATVEALENFVNFDINADAQKTQAKEEKEEAEANSKEDQKNEEKEKEEEDDDLIVSTDGKLEEKPPKPQNLQGLIETKIAQTFTDMQCIDNKVQSMTEIISRSVIISAVSFLLRTRLCVPSFPDDASFSSGTFPHPAVSRHCRLSCSLFLFLPQHPVALASSARSCCFF